MGYILALDQGTTSSRALVFDTEGRHIASAHEEFKQLYPQPGYVEHCPEDILNSQMRAAKKAIESAGIKACDIISAGITNQRETVIVWDKNTARPVFNAIVWQCRRTADLCERLKREGLEQRIFDKTGLALDAYFSASKIKWILDNVDGAKKRAQNGELLFGTVDTYLLWCLTKGKVHATDYSNASRTMLFNIHKLCWDDELLRIFDIPLSMLPAVYPSSYDYGIIDGEFFGAPVPVTAIAGDQQAAMFGQTCFEAGSMKNTYGTGCFLLMNTLDKPVVSRRGLITTLLASGDYRPHYALEGSVFMGGAVIKWLRDELRIIDAAADSEVLANSVSDNGGVYFVPAFVGLGAPYWDSYPKGLITGLTGGATRAHIVRAALEAIAYQVFDVIHAMERDSGTAVMRLNADGGASVNDFLMQFQADLINAEVARSEFTESTALGVYYLSGLAAGVFKDTEQISKLSKKHKIFKPHLDAAQRKMLLGQWAHAVARARKK